MNAAELAARLNAKITTGNIGTNREIKGVYCCDLLSWVMSHADRGSAGSRTYACKYSSSGGVVGIIVHHNT